MKKLLLSILVVLGLAGNAFCAGPCTAFHEKVDIPIKDYMAGIRNGHYTVIDNYLQYMPITSTMLLCIPKSGREGWQDKLLLGATGMAAMGIMVNSLKYTVCEMRPDGSRRNSFPSGHTATAFVGAELVRMEYGGWWGAAAYTMAAATGFLRMYNEKHWCSDVLAGAGIGFLSAKIAGWMLPWERRQLGKVSFLPWYAPAGDGTNYSGLALSIVF